MRSSLARRPLRPARPRRSPLAVRAAGAVVAVSALLTVTAACTSKSDEAPRVAGDKGGEGDAQSQEKKADQIRQQWTKCMHDAGHTDVKVGPNGGVAMPAQKAPQDGEDAEKAEKEAKALEEAIERCNDKVPGMQQLQEDQKPSEKNLKNARALTSCLRKNGLPDIADPDPKAGAISLPSDMDQEAWNKAFGICGKKYPNVPIAVQKAGGGEQGEQ